jgi:hypothetical protein
MVTRHRFALCLALALSGCNTGFSPETLVDHLRVLGVRATPADLAPGETALLEGLILDPTRPAMGVTTFWLGCDPDPYDLNRSACSDPTVLSDPSALGQGDLSSLPAGVHPLGVGTSVHFSAAATLFDPLAAGDPRRITGTTGQALAISVTEQVSPTATAAELSALFARVRSGEVRSLVTLFRLHISEDPQRNHNPGLGHWRVAGERWPDGAHVMVLPKEEVHVDLDVPDDDFETFTTQASPDTQTERILAAWYSTSGRFSQQRTALREDVLTVFTAPGAEAGDPVPDDRLGTLWSVLRDTRGGTAWQTAPLYVCDATLPTPQVTRVTPGTPWVVEGQHLDALLDVVVDDVALADGSYSPASGTWEGSLTVASGAHHVTALTRACGRLDLGTVTTP